HTRAAVTPISALTACQWLIDRARIAAGQQVLIHGAAGGVGGFAVQLARWRGARVTATAGAGDSDFVRGLGADDVIDYLWNVLTVPSEAKHENMTTFESVSAKGGTLCCLCCMPSWPNPKGCPTRSSMACGSRRLKRRWQR